MDFTTKGVVGEVVAATAEEFLDLVEPRRSGLLAESTRAPSQWIFRGHGDASWSLLPSSLRDGTKFWFGGAWGWVDWATDNPPNRAQVFKEALGVEYFFSLADREGLALPGDSPELRSQLSRITGSGDHIARLQQWPPDDLLPVLALAQHHGLPTRLLDWTYNPFTAAYFAAKAAIERERSDLMAAYVKAGGSAGFSRHRKQDFGDICVWILSASFLRTNTEFHEPGRASLVLVTAPTATNPNLRAQEGVFTLTRCKFDPGASVDRRPLTETLSEVVHPEIMEGYRAAARKDGLGDVPLLLRVKVPAAEAPRILWQLALQGTTAAKLYPGYQGVVQAMKDEVIWDHLKHRRARTS